MIIHRWQAPIVPNLEMVQQIFEQEGMATNVENLPPQTQHPDHRHPYDEIRMIVEGELLFNIAGSQLLLRPGDRIQIPANTKHSYANNRDSQCVSVVCLKPF